jgi:RNA polymerase sigma-70 factor (ECF subfamily)
MPNEPAIAQDTQALLAAVGRGDAAAVNNLLERHRATLRRAVQLRLDRALARRVDASDVVQDVLLEAHRRLSDYVSDPRLPFPVWLRQLAHDRVIEMHRQHRVSQRRSLDREQGTAATFDDRSSFDLLQQLADPELTPAAANIRRELEQRFLAALDQLEEEDREIIWLRHFDQLGNSEAAAMLGFSPAAAGMRHLRALRRLRSILGEKPNRSDPP